MYINLDETAIERLIGRRHGNVVVCSSSSPHHTLLHERLRRQDTHGHLTLVALATPDVELQPHLPQIFLTKDARLTRAERAKLEALAPPLRWFRGSDGWITSQNMPSVLTFIRREVLRLRPSHEIVLVMDCAAQHLAGNVINHCRRLRLHVLFVPARMTWLLQPLDTHIFGKLKRRLHALQLLARSTAPQGVLERAAWIDILSEGVQQVLVAGLANDGFHANGVLGDTGSLRPRVQQLLEGFSPPALECPTVEDICALIGSRRLEIGRSLLARAQTLASAGGLAIVPRATRLPPPPLPPPADPPEHVERGVDAPIAHRTRSRSSMTLAAELRA